MLTFRFADEKDINLLFEWANDETARKNSYNSNRISYEDHVNWFNKRINSEDFSCYIFLSEGKLPVGQVRIEKTVTKKEAVISILVDKEYRGKGLSSIMLHLATSDFLTKNQGYKIVAYIFKNNRASYRSFQNAGYKSFEEVILKGVPSYVLYYI
jgi:RimJ/RimL family protein N-acetyltransferase